MALPQEIGLLIDIGSEGVSTALAIFPATHETPVSAPNIPHIVYESFHPAALQKESDVNAVIGTMVSTLTQALIKVEKEGPTALAFTKLGHQKINKVHITLSSPWYLSQTKVLKVRKDAPFAVTADFMKNLVELEKKNFRESLALGPYAANFNEKLQVIESKVILTKLNGYETNKPAGKTALKVEVALYLSVASEELVKKITSEVEKKKPGVPIVFHTFPIVAFSSVRDLPDVPAHFLLVDVGAEMTDIKRGIAVQTITLPHGKNELLRAILKYNRAGTEATSSLLSLYTSGKLDAETKRQIQGALTKPTKEWQLALSESLERLSEDRFIPGAIYLVVEAAAGSLYSNLISGQALGHGGSSGTPFSVTLLDHDHIKSQCNIEHEISDDPSLALEALFINKVRGQ